MTTITLNVELAPAGISREERVALQQKQLAELAPVFEAADHVRLYADEARNFAFSSDEKSLHFIADAKREVARGAQYDPPAYDNLMCFIKSVDGAPLGWMAAPQRLHEPRGGLHPDADAELSQFLDAHPGGCVLSFNMTSTRSSISVFPGPRSPLLTKSDNM
jgi:hypothetical protein